MRYQKAYPDHSDLSSEPQVQPEPSLHESWSKLRLLLFEDS